MGGRRRRCRLRAAAARSSPGERIGRDRVRVRVFPGPHLQRRGGDPSCPTDRTAQIASASGRITGRPRTLDGPRARAAGLTQHNKSSWRT
ncbi:hypothetical protein [Oryza sativa Japonica Group]|uniref:Uncharacterized protein n=1 Tax=Oryza sativa subsp. japonica TaxID=39947 RepID=Q5ZAR8_ORYSJ|nr:hypothetical protein [Oryza sativa Japonica Group]